MDDRDDDDAIWVPNIVFPFLFSLSNNPITLYQLYKITTRYISNNSGNNSSIIQNKNWAKMVKVNHTLTQIYICILNIAIFLDLSSIYLAIFSSIYFVPLIIRASHLIVFRCFQIMNTEHNEHQI